MEQTRTTMSVFRLLLKVTGYIGPAAFAWVSEVGERQHIHPVEGEILERTFSTGVYPDELLELSCHTALAEEMFRISEFPFLVEEVKKKLRTHT